ncbi:MAG: DUF2723 domain-containing protein [bacterium]
MRKKDDLPIPFKTIDYIFGILVLFVCFGVYLHTLTPTVGFHDSGELITCAWTLGIAHPPGYPLYTLLGKVFITLIPIGNIAFRMNMQSALFASLCVMMTYFITLKLSTRAPEHQSTRIIPSIVASLILAFSLTFWEQAVIAEKYTLNAFFATLIIFILLKWQDSRLKTQDFQLLYLFCFVLGLSFTHHFQTIYLIPASIFFILAVLWKNRKNSKFKTQKSKLKTRPFSLPTLYSLLSTPSKMLLLFILPLTLWAYLPIRSSMHPPLNWGCPDNWQRFVEHLTGKSYQPYLGQLISSFKSRLLTHLGFFPHQFNVCLIFLGLLGLIFLIAKRLKLGVYLCLMAITNFFMAIRYDISNIEDYYIPSFLIFAILIGYCLFSVLCLLSSKFFPVLKIALCGFFLLFPILQCRAKYYSSDHFNYYIAYDHGRNMLEPLRKKALVFLEYKIDQPGFLFWYLQHIENLRKDVATIKLEFLPFQYYIKELKEKYPDVNLTVPTQIQIIENNLGNRPVYVRDYEKVSEIYKGYTLIPEGILWRLTKDTEFLVEEILKNKDFKIRKIKSRREKGMTFENICELQTILLYAHTLCTRGKYLSFFKRHNLAINETRKAVEILEKFGLRNLRNVKKEYKDYINTGIAFYIQALFHLSNAFYKQGDLDKAIFECRNGLMLDPTNIGGHGQLGVIYFEKGLNDKAIKEFERILELDPENSLARHNLQLIQESEKIFVDKNEK